MDIQGPQKISGVGRVEGRRIERTRPPQEPQTAKPPDTVEISPVGRYLDVISQIPEIRQERVDEIKRAIENGEYVTDERIRATVDRILEELS